jgi:hypothetical protein
MQELAVGALYQHYRNQKFYRVRGVVRHSESLEEMVLYEALYENELGKLWVRPKAMFSEDVDFEGKKVPRFKRVAEDKAPALR